MNYHSSQSRRAIFNAPEDTILTSLLEGGKYLNCGNNVLRGWWGWREQSLWVCGKAGGSVGLGLTELSCGSRPEAIIQRAEQGSEWGSAKDSKPPSSLILVRLKATHVQV